MATTQARPSSDEERNFLVGPRLRVPAPDPTQPPPPAVLSVSFELQDLPGIVPVITDLGVGAARQVLDQVSASDTSAGLGAGTDRRQRAATGEMQVVFPQRLVFAPLMQLGQQLATQAQSTFTSWATWAASTSTANTARPSSSKASSSAPQGVSTQLPWADIASLTMGGFAPGYKESNQDSCFVYSPFGTPRQLLLGVMDGHGFEGHWVSNLARKHLPAAVFNGLLSQTDQQHDSNEKDKRQLHSKRSSTTDKVDGSGGSASSSRSGGGVQLQAAPAALVSMWESAFQRVDDLLAHSGVDVSGSGSTAVVVHVSGTRLTTAWVGDSRAVMAWRTMQPPPPPTTASSAVSWLARLLSGGGGAAESDASSYASSSYVYTPSARGSAWSHPLDLSEDHKPDLPREARRISLAGGRVARQAGSSGHPAGPYRVWLAGADYPGLAMSRALGDRPARAAGVTAVPEVSVLDLTDVATQLTLDAADSSGTTGSSSKGVSKQQQGQGQRVEALLVLASDGVWEFMSSGEAVAVAGSHASAVEGCKALIQEARRRWMREYGGAYIDDITAVVARLDCTALLEAGAAEGGTKPGATV